MKSFIKEAIKMNNTKRGKIFFHVILFCILLKSKKTEMRVAEVLIVISIKYYIQLHIFENMKNKIHH